MKMIPPSSSLNRGLVVLDHTPHIYTSKVGMLYSSASHGSSEDMLTSCCGSPGYVNFMRDMGEVCNVRDLKLYSGGLDRTGCRDGKFALRWRSCDRESYGSMVLFHAPSLMPDDADLVQRMSHVGNDFVHVVYSDVGGGNHTNLGGDFGTVVVNVACLKDRSLKLLELSIKLNGDVSALPYTSCGKFVCHESDAANYARFKAIVADVMCKVWRREVVGDGNWMERLDIIRRLKGVK